MFNITNYETFNAQYVDDNTFLQSYCRKLIAQGQKNFNFVSKVINNESFEDGYIACGDYYVLASDLQNALYNSADMESISAKDTNGDPTTISLSLACSTIGEQLADYQSFTSALEAVVSDDPLTTFKNNISANSMALTSKATAFFQSVLSTDVSKKNKLATIITGLSPDQTNESDINQDGITVTNDFVTNFSGFKLWANSLNLSFSFNASDLISMWKSTWRTAFSILRAGLEVLKAIRSLNDKLISWTAKWLKKTYITGTDRFELNGSTPYCDNGFLAFSMNYTGSLVKYLYDKGSIMNIIVPGGLLMLWVLDQPSWDDEDEVWEGTITMGFKPQLSLSNANLGSWPLDGSEHEEQNMHWLNFNYVDELAEYNRNVWLSNYNANSQPEAEGLSATSALAAKGGVQVFTWWLITQGDSSKYTNASYRNTFRTCMNSNYADAAGTTVDYTVDPTAMRDIAKYCYGYWNPTGLSLEGLNVLLVQLQQFLEGQTDENWFLPYFYTLTTEIGDIHGKSDKEVLGAYKRTWVITLAVIAAISVSVGIGIGLSKLKNAAILARRDADVTAFDENATAAQIKKTARKAAFLEMLTGSSSNTLAEGYNLLRIESLIH